ncbi:uncharacterized protein LOC120105846 [Phoenix dactylifera]|uniref:Uncharacterized protein LOC120105846 n=1 Tax=Phoenix dactylifera TaxID=42345 RepID=A0A8B8ZK03_PHODC|nr:uncharacterized protein LOC120105846 [Phoenix dactylifera]
MGGLGVIDLSLFDKCLLLKRWWRYFSEQNKEWRKLIYSLHYNKECPSQQAPLSLKNASHAWKAVIKNHPLFNKTIKFKFGNGREMAFWHDLRLGEEPLKNSFPNIYLLTFEIRGLLGDYDAIHVRRGDKIKTRKDRHGVERSLHPHLDRDTRPEFIQQRIAKWIPPGRTLFIASNERSSGFFSPLSARYKLAYSSNFSSILDPVIQNNYQLFMVERLILVGAKTFIKTFKEDENDISLTDDPKKNTKSWQIPVYTIDGWGS